jgi:hypothetical protein
MKKALTLCGALWIALSFGQLASEAANDFTIRGYISCSTCGAKGATSSHGDCMQKCLAKGAQVVIVVDDTQNIMTIENPDSVGGQHAHHVALFGYMNAGSFHVISVRIL